MRKITNSAGRTGAMPISQMRRPFRMSSCVIVVSSHVMKNASSSVRPKSAPRRHWPRRNNRIVSLTRAHRRWSFGSNTTLCAFVDRALEEDEEPAHAHVFAERVRGHRARAPHADATAGELADD